MILTAALQPYTSYWNKVGNGRSAVSSDWRVAVQCKYLQSPEPTKTTYNLRKPSHFPPDYKTLWFQIDMSMFQYLMSITAVYSPTGMRGGGRGRPGGCCRGGSTTGRRTARGSARWWRGRCCGPSWSCSARHSAGSHSPGPWWLPGGSHYILTPINCIHFTWPLTLYFSKEVIFVCGGNHTTKRTKWIKGF